jgi:hypothetical protein
MNAVPPAARARRARTPVRAWLAAVVPVGTALAGLVAALVIGIVGMHALGSHGAPATVAALATHAGPDQQAAHEHGAAVVVALTPSTASHGDGAGDTSANGSGHGLGVVMLCAVMLGAAALRLLALLATGHLRRVRLKVFAPLAATVRPRHLVRGHGPPPVWQFSVIRC